MIAAAADAILAGLSQETLRRLVGQRLVYANETVMIVATPGLIVRTTLVNLEPSDSGRLRVAAVIEVEEVVD